MQLQFITNHPNLESCMDYWSLFFFPYRANFCGSNRQFHVGKGEDREPCLEDRVHVRLLPQPHEATEEQHQCQITQPLCRRTSSCQEYWSHHVWLCCPVSLPALSRGLRDIQFLDGLFDRRSCVLAKVLQQLQKDYWHRASDHRLGLGGKAISFRKITTNCPEPFPHPLEKSIFKRIPNLCCTQLFVRIIHTDQSPVFPRSPNFRKLILRL